MLGASSNLNWLKVSPLEVLITRACDPSVHEPNYAVHLEVAEFINTKKANTPREAAMTIARLANHRNPHIAILALALLDTLVQSCGYPFHLQIATKEFLNELVKRFPERPPPFPNPIMSRILDCINGWKDGICVESRWREDLGNIRDMHRLLTYKGYRFRPVVRQQSLATASNLKSAEELESEDREAQSAKLQELIRRGTPRDLAAAQELMKALAGANPETKPDYRTQALTDLNKLEQKVILMNEMLDNVDTTKGEKLVAGDVYEQVASILVSARPKIQKWISDAETDDSESLDTFLQINDQINTVLNRYEAFKKGDYATSSNPIPAELSTGSSAKNDNSLIDFDTSTSPKAVPGTSAQEELASLFGPPSSSTTTNPQVPAAMGTTAPQTYATSFPSTNFNMGMGMGMGMPTPNTQMPAAMGTTRPQMYTQQMPSNQPGIGLGMMGMNMGLSNTRNSIGTTAPQMYASPIPSTNFGMGMGMGMGPTVSGATPPMNHFAMPHPTIQSSGTPPLQQFGSIMLTDTPQIPAMAPSVFGGPSMVNNMMIPQRPQSQPNQQPFQQQLSVELQQPGTQTKDPFADLVELI